MRKFRKKTWICQSCGYKQEFDINDFVTMNRLFPGIQPGKCPACGDGPVIEEQDSNSKIILHILEDLEIDNLSIDGNNKGRKITRVLTQEEKISLKQHNKKFLQDHKDSLEEFFEN